MNFVVEKNLMVPMRDGTRLATDLYRPMQEGPFPTLVIRSPYNKDGSTAISNSLVSIPYLVQADYAVIMQDCRGRFSSEGTFLPFAQEINDGVDTLAWAASQSWSTGKVGTLGASYLGTAQWLPAAQQPEALRAMIPSITPSDLYGTLSHRQGAFELGNMLVWCLSIALGNAQRLLEQGQATMEDLNGLLSTLEHIQDAYQRLPLLNQPLLSSFSPFYSTWLEHDSYDDFWRKVAPKETYERITVPAFHIGGWYDLFLGGVLESYTGMKERSGSSLARQQQRLIIGPWSHVNQTGSFPERDYGLRANIESNNIIGAQIRWKLQRISFRPSTASITTAAIPHTCSCLSLRGVKRLNVI